MTKRLMRVLLSTLALAILLIVGLGFVYMVTVKEDALGVATFHHKTWIPLLVLALGAAAVLLIEFAHLLRDKEARKMRWEGKAALQCAGLMLLCCVPAGLCAAADAAMDLPGRVQIALYLLSGAAALWVLRRGNRAAGIALLCIGAVGIAAFFLVLKFFSTGGYENAGFLAARVINGFFSKACLSAYGFCVFGGVKAMMKG